MIFFKYDVDEIVVFRETGTKKRYYGIIKVAVESERGACYEVELLNDDRIMGVEEDDILYVLERG